MNVASRSSSGTGRCNVTSACLMQVRRAEREEDTRTRPPEACRSVRDPRGKGVVVDRDRRSQRNGHGLRTSRSGSSISDRIRVGAEGKSPARSSSTASTPAAAAPCTS